RRISGFNPRESKDITTPDRPDRCRCSFQGDAQIWNDKNHNVMKGRSVAVFVMRRINYPERWQRQINRPHWTSAIMSHNLNQSID
ncbi:hypothetical protein, partial [Salmonella enterica]|uniref:hypothetical protein n=1 Tax=Salmonella enterica TaxID=28901 RepID=UPI002AFFD9C4